MWLLGSYPDRMRGACGKVSGTAEIHDAEPCDADSSRTPEVFKLSARAKQDSSQSLPPGVRQALHSGPPLHDPMDDASEDDEGAAVHDLRAGQRGARVLPNVRLQPVAEGRVCANGHDPAPSRGRLEADPA